MAYSADNSNEHMSDAMLYAMHHLFKSSMGGRRWGKTSSIPPNFIKPGYSLKYLEHYEDPDYNFWSPIFKQIDIENAVIEQ